ncbi:MAG: GNAT family N-acetyltransferase [Rhodocyclaceae bacterium]
MMTTHIQTGTWQQLQRPASDIRHEVFIVEQKVPADMEYDEHDAASLHAVAWRGDAAIGTARLLDDGHIGRVAVRKEARGQGVGRELMLALMAAAQTRGMPEIVLNAQLSASEFYRVLGFEVEGEMFMEAGIEHCVMRKRLAAATDGV